MEKFMLRRNVRHIGVEFEDPDKPLFMISAVARMITVHPQTLRLYERMGFIIPQRTEGKKRMYSVRDVQRLRFIQNLTRERGVNLAGVRMILKLQRQADQLQQEMRKILESLKERIYEKPEAAQGSSKWSSDKRVRIKIERG
jgi:MerR family transcriptional regulator, heat shock protein HspR